MAFSIARQRTIKKMLLGAAPDSVASRDSLANPEALDAIADWITATRS